MTDRTIANKQLANFLSVFGHPHRIHIVEELRHAEKDVNTIQSTLNISHSGVSQHLAILRANNVVVERREGRHVIYRLVDTRIADWLLDGMQFLETDAARRNQIGGAVRRTREAWISEDQDAMGPANGSGALSHDFPETDEYVSHTD